MKGLFVQWIRKSLKLSSLYNMAENRPNVPSPLKQMSHVKISIFNNKRQEVKLPSILSAWPSTFKPSLNESNVNLSKTCPLLTDFSLPL